MYYLLYKKTQVKNLTIHLPTSKSISNRALILNALLPNKITIQNLSQADDTVLMQDALQNNSSEINLQNAGTCMRFLTAYYACKPNTFITLLCHERMTQRPIQKLVDALVELGANIHYLQSKNFPPLHIKGEKLIGKELYLNANESSQFITALLLIAPFIENGLVINLTENTASFSYIKMTILLMQKWGFNALLNEKQITIKPFLNENLISTYTIEPDWSSAAFWYLVVFLNNELTINLSHLSLKSIQGDSITAEVFEKLGVQSFQNEQGIIIQKTMPAQTNLSFNLIDCIDLAPALCVACAVSNNHVTINGLQNLAIKESNRLTAIVNELGKLGYNLSHTENAITIIPNQFIDYNKEVCINTYSDHRIAMAFAPLAMLFTRLHLNEIAVVSKSYPTYFLHLAMVGIVVK